MFSRPSARVAYFLGMLVVFALTEAWLPPRFSQFLNGNWAGDLVFGGMLLTFVGTTGPSPDRDALWVVPLYLGALTAIDVACHRGGVPMAWEWVAIAGVVVGIGLIQRLRGRRVLPAFTGTRWLSPPGQRWRDVLVLLGLLTIAGSALLVRHYPVLTMLATPVILIAILIPLNAKLPWWVEKDPR